MTRTGFEEMRLSESAGAATKAHVGVDGQQRCVVVLNQHHHSLDVRRHHRTRRRRPAGHGGVID